MWDRERGFRRPNWLQAALILTVGVSGGLVAINADASPAAVALATVAGLVVGTALTAYLTAIAPSSGGSRDRRREF